MRQGTKTMKEKNLETRAIDVKEARLKIEKREDGKSGKISGYAAVFNRDSENMGFIERIAPGAFKSAIRNGDVRALRNHNPDFIFGRQGVNMRLKEDDTGLWMEVDPVDTPAYRSMAADIEAGLITQQSFGFTVEKDEWKDQDKETPKRTIVKVARLFDVSPITYPAYPDTSVALRSLDKIKKDAATGAQSATAHRARELKLKERQLKSEV
jgi:HK97 family phage prohead protease